MAWVVAEQDAGLRLDVFLAGQLPDYSRSVLRRLIPTEAVRVDGEGAKVAYRLRAGQRVTFLPAALPREPPQPEEIPLEILYEDDHLVVINKPAGMVVHPAKGHWRGTLTSALAFHFQQLSTVGGPTRPGIVHRLDRDTSGVMVVAKTDAAHHKLAAQFERREVEKEYFAIVCGVVDRDRDEICEPIGPHPYQREKMAIRRDHPEAREASTFYEVLQRFSHHTAVKVLPKTGRTHQIRLHLLHIGHPVLCDRLYSGRATITRGDLTGSTADDQLLLARQALHARRLTLQHPFRGERLEWIAPMADDIQAVLEVLSSPSREAP
ncbi:MAG: RluA family pseudouridine synthase [Planctomycetales bacterium]|nr:RluA family pseudouridine synthase [Planctomycetales bacterium]